MAIVEEYYHKTSFMTPSKSIRLDWNAVRVSERPKSFQRSLELILSGASCNKCLVYFEDVLIFSRKLDDEVLALLENAGVSLKIRSASSSESPWTTLGTCFYTVSSPSTRVTPMP